MDEHPEYFTRYAFTVRDCIGNGIADKLAIRAAEAAEVPHEAAVPVSQMIAYAQLIQRRLVAILRGANAGFS